MAKKKIEQPSWAPRYRTGDRVNTPEGEREIEANWGRSYCLNQPVGEHGKKWFDESELIEWEQR